MANEGRRIESLLPAETKDMPYTEPTKANATDSMPSPFQKWMEEHGQPPEEPGGLFATTTLQQFQLATELCNQAEGTSFKTTQEVIDNLKQTGFSDYENMNLVRWEGLSVTWFLDVFCQTKSFQRMVNFGCEIWFVRRVGILEILRRLQKPKGSGRVSSGTLVDHVTCFSCDEEDIATPRDDTVKQRPTVFVSYTGRCRLDFLLESLGKLREEYIWMDVFCVDQFAWTLQQERIMTFRDDLIDGLRANIEAIGHTVLLMEKWDNAMHTLNQIWVLWEIYNTHISGAKFHVILSLSEKNRLLVDVTGGKIEKMSANFSSIDLQNAVAENELDCAAILRELNMQDDELYAASCTVSDSVRHWLCDYLDGYGRFALQELEVQTQVTREERINLLTFCSNNAAILSYQGRDNRAEFFFRTALEGYRTFLGSKDDDTLRALTNYATYLIQEGRRLSTDATYFAHEAYETCLELHGLTHTQTLGCMQTLASLFEAKGDGENAFKWIEKEWSAWQSLADDVDWHNRLMCMQNYASKLVELRRNQEARSIASALVDERTRRSGENDRNTLAARRLQAVMSMEHDPSKALEELSDVYERQRRSLGRFHLATLRTLYHVALAMTLVDNCRMSEVDELLLHLIFIQKKFLGEDHPDTLRSMLMHSALLLNSHFCYEAAGLAASVVTIGKRIWGPKHENVVSAERILERARRECKFFNTLGIVLLGGAMSLLWTLGRGRKRL